MRERKRGRRKKFRDEIKKKKVATTNIVPTTVVSMKTNEKSYQLCEICVALGGKGF